jgi:hypothetical protein
MHFIENPTKKKGRTFRHKKGRTHNLLQGTFFIVSLGERGVSG